MIAVDIREAVDAMLGKPFRRHARGPEAYDCLGVFLSLAETVAGVRIESPFQETVDLAGFARRFLELQGAADLRPLDVLLRHHGEDLVHLSVVESPKWAVTAEDPIGVVRVRLADAARTAQRVYRLKELV